LFLVFNKYIYLFFFFREAEEVERIEADLAEMVDDIGY